MSRKAFNWLEKESRSLWGAVGLLFIALAISTRAIAQQPALPMVNLGDTSFLDAIAFPGGVVEEIGQGVHDDRTTNIQGQPPAAKVDVNSVTSLTHLAWISHQRFMGAWYGAETVLSAAYVDTGGHGSGGGFGDVTLGPVILQWPEQHLKAIRLYQRFVLDLDAPLGQYSKDAAVNMGNNAWDVHPYYAVTLMPSKRIETSWRLHYLWNGQNSSPPSSLHARSDQAGQAFHFNGTLAYELWKGFYLGANGYYLRQLTDHRIDGAPIAGRQQLGALGPGFVLKHERWFLFANGYHEFGAKNMAEGNKVVLRVSRVF